MSPGPRYLATTLALLAVGTGYALLQGRPEQPAPRPLARSEALLSPPPSPLPVAGEILDRRAALSLTADQVSRLQALDLRWQTEVRELEGAVEVAAQEFSRFMKDAQSAGGASVQEIQRRSAEFRELSAALRERRRLHAEVATRVLTEPQRQKLAAATAAAPPGGGR